MEALVSIVNDFNFESNMPLNPKKYENLKIGNDEHIQFRIEDPISYDSNLIDCSYNPKVIRYLGSTLAMGKLSKMKLCNQC
jgi:hypothetical protein